MLIYIKFFLSLNCNKHILEIAHKYYQLLSLDELSFIYLGDFDSALAESFSQLNEVSTQDSKTVKSKVSFLISECFQNVIKHADKPELVTRTNNKPSMFIVREINNSYIIGSTNLVDNTKKDRLGEKIKSISKLNPSELNSIYKSALAENENTSDAGLGLINMAQKSSYPIEFEFEFLNYFLSIFYIQTTIKSKEKSNEHLFEDDIKERSSLNYFKTLYKKMIDEDVLMIRKGDFSQQSIIPLLNIIESNLSSQSKWKGVKKKTIYLLIEMLQNMSLHGKPHDGVKNGIIIITKKYNHLSIISGNFISKEAVEPLESHLNELIDLNETELQEKYNKIILKETDLSSHSTGIGLIEIMKFGNKKLSYNFTPVSDIESFFSMCITI